MKKRGSVAVRYGVRITVVAGATGAIAVLTLLAVAAVAGSWMLAAPGVAIGVLMIIVASVVTIRIAERLAANGDQAATRAKNIESRLLTLTERGASVERAVSEHSEALKTLMLDVERVSLMGQGSGQIDASEAESLAQHDALEATSDGNVTVQLDAVRRDLRILRGRVPAGFLRPVEAQIEEARNLALSTLRVAFESAVQHGREVKGVISEEGAELLFADYLRREQYLQLRPLIKNFGLLGMQNLTTLRKLYRVYRAAGYWDLAADAVAQVHQKSGLDNDAHAVSKIQHEIELFSQPTLVRTSNLPDGPGYDPAGPILHMVGRVLPQTQTGYTLRTQYSAQALKRKGLPVAIVAQVGITESVREGIERYEHQGVDYYLLPGEQRKDMLIDDWLRQNMIQLAELVKRTRPSILHAQSDFFNLLIVNAVGKKYGIPTVYESRGFWEESWLSRVITANDWERDSEALFAMYGLPAAYCLRKHAEEVARLLPDHVFTLAEVMRDHILASAHGSLIADGVTIVPNAVEASNFPVQEPDSDLSAEIGLPQGAVTVGYISSMVEYEGIDTLIDAYHLASARTTSPMCLLLVGDGDYLPELKAHVSRKNIKNVYFTGRVPHENILRYYGLIDLFVVPRKKTDVADLVTPLKPFEAFATGRAVILSDVDALQEIADQSGAVETFHAESADDLAHKLLTLIDDPDRRKELGTAAARWVRNHRSWDRNANEYYRVYRKLGYEGPRSLVVESELSLGARGINPGELIEALARNELPSSRGWFTIQEIRQPPEAILEVGWRFASFEPVPVARLQDWAPYGREHRSWGFHLHAWEFMDPLIRAFDESEDSRWLVEAVRIATGWIQIHRTSGDADDPMIWYDMSQALRTPRLIGLTLRAARFPDLRDYTVILAEALAWHLDELHRDRAFNPNNNHGFYTAISQVHAAKYVWMFPDAEATALEGRQRLAHMARAQFASDGVHLEHSPDYHRMLLNSFELAVNDGLIDDQEVKNRVEHAAHVMGWMIQPDGTLVQLGDSPETQMIRPDAMSIDPQTQFLLSDGERGEKPTQELAVFHEGGYAFVRSPQPDGPGVLRDSGYLAFSAAFHSRAHKHADDLNVVWYERGQQILTDGGRFGYGELLPPESSLRREGFYYAAPERQYVEGTMAHNTLMMDGRNQDRRARSPYGSGLGDCFESEGVFDLSGRVHHADYIHRRRVVYRPGQELLLKDSVFSQSPETREGVLWFNVSGHFELAASGQEVIFEAATPEGVTRLIISGPGRLLEPVRGGRHPMRGWRSRQDRSLEPTWSIGYAFEIDTRASVDTRLRLE